MHTIHFLTRFILFISLFQFTSCIKTELANPCDPSSKANQNTILTKILIGDNTPFCGVRLITPTAIKSWTQEAYLKAPNAEAEDWFGTNLAIYGETLAVSSLQEDSNQTLITNGSSASTDNSSLDSGAVYLFRREKNSWINEAYLKASNSDANDLFGFSLSLSNDTLVVGSVAEDSNQTSITNGTTSSLDNSVAQSGAVYVFRRTGNLWLQEAYLKAPNANSDDQFGNTVSISDDTIVVGAVFEDSNQTTITNGTTGSPNNASVDSGAAYVFRRTGNSWFQEAYLKPPNPGANDQFATSVSISLDTVVVGALREDSNQTTITNGSTASADNSLAQSGAAYVFRRNGSTWTNEAYLKSPNVDADDQLGVAVSISNDTIVVGALNEDSNQTTITNGSLASSDDSLVDSGAAYVFRRRENIWSQEAYLKAPNADTGDKFGQYVFIFGDTIVIGTIEEDSSESAILNGVGGSSDNASLSSGAAYVFKRKDNQWEQEAFLKPSNPGAGDLFGFRPVIFEDAIAIGAPREDSNQTTITNGNLVTEDNSASNAGAVYVFVRK